MAKALIVDDEPDIRELLDITLSRMNIDSDCAADLSEARNLLEKNQYQVCLTDMKLPDGNGIDLVRLIQKKHPDMPVAVLTAHGNMDTAIQSMKAGAFDFVSKPIELERLRSLVNTALKLQSDGSDDNSPHKVDIAGESEAIIHLRNKIKKLSRSQAPVYISGESGSGKELTARAIHEQGPLASGPFIAVNCGAIPRELMESEFFGHKKGSFTGAHKDHIGLFESANGGTLFLDEVADLPLDMQVKLLRAIQEKSVRSIGSQKETPVDARILSATHKNLSVEVSENRFRKDLFYRINVIELPVPTLRDRADDIKLLAQRFLVKMAKKFDETPVRLTKDALQTLNSYRFPGNIRELENILERAYTLCENDEIHPSDLHLEGTPNQAQPNTQEAELEGETLDEHLEDIERGIIVKTLEENRWNRTAAAKKLGVSFRSLRYRLKKLGLDREE